MVTQINTETYVEEHCPHHWQTDRSGVIHASLSDSPTNPHASHDSSELILDVFALNIITHLNVHGSSS